MRLSDFKLPSQSELIIDSEIKAFGLLGDIREGVVVYVEDESYLPQVANMANTTCIIAKRKLKEKILDLNGSCGLIISDSPKRLFYSMYNEYAEHFSSSDVRKSTIIGRNTYISENAHVADTGVNIGDDCVIAAGAVINSGVIIGNGCFIGENTVLGTRGFQYYRDEKELFYIKHTGGIVIGDRVEIFSCCCVASGLFTPTRIEGDVKIDNLVHVSHSDIIGDHTLIAAGAVIAGSVYVGSNCWIGIGARISQGLKIGDEAQICAGAVVVSNVKSKTEVSGNFAVDHKLHLYDTKRILTKR